MAITNQALEAANNVSIFGWLENIDAWNNLPYPIKGALLRGLKAGLSVAIGGLLAAATAGTLFPASWGPLIVLVSVPILQAADKYIREWNIDNEGGSPQPEPTPEPEPEPEPTPEPEPPAPSTDVETVDGIVPDDA